MRSIINRVRRAVNAPAYVRTTGRLVALSAVVGVVAGAGAVAFQVLVQVVTHFALDVAAGYRQGSPRGEFDLFSPGSGPLRLWMLVLIPTVGGLLSAWIVQRFAPEAAGAGTDATIRAYHQDRGVIRPAVPLVKMIASALTLGTGGSGGREGPIAQIGAGFGSFLAGLLKLNDKERRVLLAAGVGSGVGAIFHAPLAGALFAVEVLYREADFEAEALMPAFISTAIAYCVFQSAMVAVARAMGMEYSGFEHLFAIAPGLHFGDPWLLLPLTALVAVMVAGSWGYVSCFFGAQSLFSRVPWTPCGRAALGAGLTGLLAVLLYAAATWVSGVPQPDILSVMGGGYGFLQEAVASADGAGLTLAVLLCVAVGKIVTTSLTIGSGGSGGLFGPSMVIGGCLGGAVGLVGRWLMPDVVQRVDVFVILGMAGFFAAVAKTPVSTLIIVSELTGGYELLLPSMWVCALAYLLSRGWTIFREQVPTRLDSPAHRAEFIVDVLQDLTVRDALGSGEKTFVTVPPHMPLKEISRLITGTHQACFPVVGDDGRYQGLFALDDLRQFLFDQEAGELAVAHDLATADAPPLSSDLDLGSAMGAFATGRFAELPVADPDQPGHVIAMLRRQDVIRAYNRALLKARMDHQAHDA